jgi:hypothetical protein
MYAHPHPLTRWIHDVAHMMLPIYVPADRNIIPYLVGYSGFGYPLPSLAASKCIFISGGKTFGGNHIFHGNIKTTLNNLLRSLKK